MIPKHLFFMGIAALIIITGLTGCTTIAQEATPNQPTTVGHKPTPTPSTSILSPTTTSSPTSDPTTEPTLEATTPDNITVDLYWVVGEEVQPVSRTIPYTTAVGTATLQALLKGIPPTGMYTAIPTPDEIQGYPGRQEDWGNHVQLLNLTIADGVATANFSQEIHAYGGGSARVQAIRQQITQTLRQFPTVHEVVIAVEGETEGVLQP
jgi:spore germination protein GerM